MNLLGFDTSTAASSACVLRADGEVFEVVPQAERLTARPAHASELMPAVADGDGARRRSAWPTSTRSRWESGPAPSPACGSGWRPRGRSRPAAGLPLRPVSSLAALAEGIEAE